ncbi:TetR/AcrR family transcriptional regulator [Oceanobacillus jeddahense]|uniref:TetR/AcrR family transcriptional regulator n=1 Tax=Oceanobacillus jeddahense TaxID=1462527 RepID=A0ABY5JPM0_9BACI|nr:TetR/AcrR family transcriptional regulator [Oceanobacillus jeddahense]UUI01422.1 TetR/AcrR family transcriptional regulator [Oceanobacillus jeddahense]
MNGFEKRTYIKRKAILETAKDLFIAKGVSEVPVEEIAQIAGVSKVTIFKYFGDKENLAREVLLPFVEEWIGYYDELMKLDILFLEKMQKITTHKSSMRQSIGHSLWNDVILNDKVMQKIIIDMLEAKQNDIYIQLIRSGKESGDIDGSIPDEAILMYINSFLSLYGTKEFVQAEEPVHSGLLKLFFKGLVGR